MVVEIEKKEVVKRQIVGPAVVNIKALISYLPCFTNFSTVMLHMFHVETI